MSQVVNGHIIYDDHDADLPPAICDGNGQVVLGLCRVCHAGEIELDVGCTGEAQVSEENIGQVFRPIICIDFDGTIHSYERGWQGGHIYGTVIAGFFEWAEEASKHFNLAVYSTRSSDEGMRENMRNWLENKRAEWLADTGTSQPDSPFFYPTAKPPAIIHIDDRAITFRGSWYDPVISTTDLRNFKPWNYK